MGLFLCNSGRFNGGETQPEEISGIFDRPAGRGITAAGSRQRMGKGGALMAGGGNMAPPL
jgi:hypothetical protein